MLIFVFLTCLKLVTCYHNVRDQIQNDLNEFDNAGMMHRQERNDEQHLLHGRDSYHPFHRRDNPIFGRDNPIFGRDEYHPVFGRDENSNRYYKRSAPVTLLTNFETKALKSHNKARSRHVNTPDLSYSKLLEDHAIAYAKKLAQTNTFKHDSNELRRYGEGENLYWARSNSPSDVCDAVFAWYNEIKDFKYDKVETDYNFFPISTTLGHFTQIVWEATKMVGCGGAYIPSLNPGQGAFDTVIVCRYKTEGNVMFDFPQNIHPLKAGVPKGFRSYKDVCGAECVDKLPDCPSKQSHCNRGFFGAELKKDCPKTCNAC